MLSSGNEEGEALAEAGGEGVAVDVSRGVGDCVGVGLGVTLGDGLALAGSGGVPGGDFRRTRSQNRSLLRCSGFAIRTGERQNAASVPGWVRAEIQVLDEAGNAAETISNEDSRPLV